LIRQFQSFGDSQKFVALEEGPMAYWISQTILPYVQDVFIADPREIPLISQNALKRDQVDARNLSRLLRLNELKRVYHPQDDNRAVFKAAVQQYIDFRNHEVELKQKIKAKYRGWGVINVNGQCVYHPKKRYSYLKRISSPVIRNLLKRLYHLLDEALRMQASSLDEATQLSKKYLEIEEFIKIPGVGIIGAMIFSAYIQTPHRFTKKSRLFRYCRLGVKDRTSDGKPLAFKRLDSNGNSELKAMSYRAQNAARIRKDNNEVKRFHAASLAVTHNPTHARLNTQRKLVSVMHGIWRNGEEYRPELFSLGYR